MTRKALFYKFLVRLYGEYNTSLALWKNHGSNEFTWCFHKAKLERLSYLICAGRMSELHFKRCQFFCTPYMYVVSSRIYWYMS